MIVGLDSAFAYLFRFHILWFLV